MLSGWSMHVSVTLALHLRSSEAAIALDKLAVAPLACAFLQELWVEKLDQLSMCQHHAPLRRLTIVCWRAAQWLPSSAEVPAVEHCSASAAFDTQRCLAFCQPFAAFSPCTFQVLLLIKRRMLKCVCRMGLNGRLFIGLLWRHRVSRVSADDAFPNKS